MNKKLLLFFMLYLSIAFQINAQNWAEIIKANAADAAGSDRFGYSVSISGDYAIVGAYQDDDNGTNSGSAYIFIRNGNSWSQQAKLTASDGAANDQFGWGVSIDGDYAIVGASSDDDAGAESGSAYIFVRNGTSWSQQAKLTASDGAAGDRFGRGVSIDGDYAVVGAYQDDDNGTNSGSAYVFNRSGTSWSQQAKLTPSDGAANDFFGNSESVSISGDYVVVGAYLDDDKGSNSGSAYIFNRSGTSWSQQAKLTASDGSANDQFGISVSISGDDVIVGAYIGSSSGVTSCGSAYIFTRSGTTWSEQAELNASDAAANDRFGHAVSISGDLAVSGAYLDSDNGASSGSAYIFERSGTSWSEQAKLTASNGAASDNFGLSVSVSGENVIVGSYFNKNSGIQTGSAFIYGKGLIYVDHSATSGDDDGTSWANAYTDLQDALDNAEDGDEIRIAEGTYKPSSAPTGTAARDYAFHITNKDVIVSGGWDASTGILTGDNTILSGDIGTIGVNTDNAYHVLVSTGQGSSTVFKNLVITDGYGTVSCGFISYNGSIYRCSGSGINMVNSDPIFENCIITNNNGAQWGAIVADAGSGPTFKNCIFSDNTNSGDGVLHANTTDNSEFYSCTFIDNTGTTQAGCLGDVGTGSLVIKNCLFYGNQGGNSTMNNYRGGVTGSSNNAADQSTAIGDAGTYVNLSSVSSSNLFEGYSNGDGTDNEWMTSDDGFRPKDRTDVILAGTSTVAPIADIIGRQRRTSPTIGAYEGNACLEENPLPIEVDSTYTSSDTSIMNGWTNYCSEGGELLLSLEIGSSGAIVDTDEVRLRLGEKTTFGYLGVDAGMVDNNDKGYQMIDRKWDVNPTTQPSTGNVGVKYYFTNQEYLDLKDSLLLHGPNQNAAYYSTLSAVTDINLNKSTSGSAFADPHDITGIVISNGATPSTTVWSHSNHGTSDHIAEFEVSSFSGGGGVGGGGGGTGAGALPVELIHFSATPAANHNAVLNWATASEINNSHFEILRSYDGRSFEIVDYMAGNGNTNELSEYRYTDMSIDHNARVVYYGLRQVDYDGANELTEVRTVNFSKDNLKESIISIFPNPARDLVYISSTDLDEALVSGELIDINGRMVLEFDLSSNITALDMSGLLPGVYYVRLNTANQVKHVKITKQ